MDRAPSVSTAEEIASLVVERLIQGGGLEDLANASLMTIEDRTIDQVDRVTRLVMDELLAKQAQQAPEVAACPKCGGPMHDKLAQHRSLQSRRGKVNFKTKVLHCEACRLDFFPSDENTAV